MAARSARRRTACWTPPGTNQIGIQVAEYLWEFRTIRHGSAAPVVAAAQPDGWRLMLDAPTTRRIPRAIPRSGIDTLTAFAPVFFASRCACPTCLVVTLSYEAFCGLT